MTTKSKSIFKMRGFVLFLVTWIALGFGINLRAESLWLKSTTSEKGIFADRKAYRVGDVLTVSITNANADSASISITRNGKKQYSIDNPAYQFLLRKAAKNFGVEVDSTNASWHSNQDTSTGNQKNSVDSAQMASVFSVLVVDILPNNNLVIEGSKRMKILDDIIMTTVRGIVRVDDINASNQVDSSKIADLNIDMLVEGNVNDTTQKGLIMKANDTLNVF